MQWTVNEKGFPTYQSSQAPFAPAIWLLQCPPQEFSLHVLMTGSDQSHTGARWKQPVAKIISLGMCSLAHAGEVAILLALQLRWQLLKRMEGASVHIDPTFTTKDRTKSGEHRKVTLATPSPPWFPNLCILGALKRMLVLENLFYFFFPLSIKYMFLLFWSIFSLQLKISPHFIIHSDTGMTIKNHNSRSFINASVGEQFLYHYRH